MQDPLTSAHAALRIPSSHIERTSICILSNQVIALYQRASRADQRSLIDSRDGSAAGHSRIRGKVASTSLWEATQRERERLRLRVREMQRRIRCRLRFSRRLRFNASKRKRNAFHNAVRVPLNRIGTAEMLAVPTLTGEIVIRF